MLRLRAAPQVLRRRRPCRRSRRRRRHAGRLARLRLSPQSLRHLRLRAPSRCRPHRPHLSIHPHPRRRILRHRRLRRRLPSRQRHGHRHHRNCRVEPSASHSLPRPCRRLPRRQLLHGSSALPPVSQGRMAWSCLAGTRLCCWPPAPPVLSAAASSWRPPLHAARHVHARDARDAAARAVGMPRSCVARGPHRTRALRMTSIGMRPCTRASRRAASPQCPQPAPSQSAASRPQWRVQCMPTLSRAQCMQICRGRRRPRARRQTAGRRKRRRQRSRTCR